MMEEWRDIAGYEGKYQVSNLGNVRNIKYHRSLKPRQTVFGYVRVALYDDAGKAKDYAVHRLVALAFIPNDHDLPCINHKNEDKRDNRAENLEWCTHLYNNHYGSREQLYEDFRHGAFRRNPRKYKSPILQLDLNGKLVRKWDSIAEIRASEELKTPNGVLACCKGKQETSNGFRWQFAI